jgi:hypothetical protein
VARTIGRRPVFFAAIVGLSLLLFYPTPSEFRWVCLLCAALAAFWAVSLALEELTTPQGPVREDGGTAPGRRGTESGSWDQSGPESPFAPPPPPGGAAGP